MSACSLPGLPTEIICKIFRSAPDFSVIAALAKTARVFYYIWRKHAGSIYKAVAPRAISNLAIAERLADEQGIVEAMEQPHGGSNKSIVRIKRLLSNMRCASAASAEWVDFCAIHKWREDQSPMTSSEMLRFQHAFYSVWAIGFIGHSSREDRDRALEYVDERSPREMFSLNEFSDWTFFSKNEFEPVNLDFKDDNWHTGREVVSMGWSSYKARGFDFVLRPQPTPEDWVAFFDHTQAWVDEVPADKC
ncbi:hypothetical protein BT63DRAFT_290565 [Microthyrium microscopicum]|uniref:F-box domain-containing protein n=1 Tax=Microthyrium microscopicum TaxID=703497 RepID=A0A6A6U504_9PEZI|nr:hypothetical protein BT63DRAFT_290565 [Microthyrium microscopicum]